MGGIIFVNYVVYYVVVEVGIYFIEYDGIKMEVCLEFVMKIVDVFNWWGNWE